MISFDQFQRYATVGNIVARVKEYKNINTDIKILEVGSNSQRNLEKFVDSEIFYTDIVEHEEFAGNDHFFVADATNLVGIKDDEYDFVVASDVFEHIPDQLREAFLSELTRVAKQYAIICFPFSTVENNMVEKRTNLYYKTIYGEDYIWLKEHIENGLPKLDVIDSFLDSKGIRYSVCKHGSVDVWEEMMKAHFYAAGIPELIDYRFDIDGYYEEYVYQYDVGDNCYRAFYMLSKTHDNKKLADDILDKLFVNDVLLREKGYDKIKTLCRDLHDLNFAKVKNKVYRSDYETSCFLNMGDGFSDENRVILENASTRKINEYVINNLSERNVSEVRFDFVEGFMCSVYELRVIADSGKELEYETNGKLNESSISFKTTDPQIKFDITEGINSVTISFYLKVANSPIDKKMFMYEYDNMAEISDMRKEAKEEKKELSIIKSKNNELENEINRLSTELNAVYLSTSWRITRPLRGVSTIFSRANLVDYTREFFGGIKRDGMRHTLWRVKNKLVKKSNGDYLSRDIAIDPVEENILFSILVPLYNTDITCLKELIESVLSQTYSNWELVLGDASNKNTDAIAAVCNEYADRDARIKYFKIEENMGISSNTNECEKRASGDYIVLCDHDDIILKEALQANAWMIQNTGADVLYSDEDHIDMKGNHFVPLFKPDWSPDLLRSQMYVCHLFVFKKSLFEDAGGLNSEFDGSQDYDLMLRFSEVTDKIVHIPLVLYSWREIETSTAANADSKPYAHEAGRRALEAHLQRVYGKDAKAISTEHTFLFEPRFGIVEKVKPLVSIIMPMKDQVKLSRQCVESIIRKSTYDNYEILILNNRSEKEETFTWFEKVQRQYDKVRVIDADFEFNWSKLNNFGIENAGGDVYIFLNNDTLVISENWMEVLCDNALREDVGVVGPMLVYEDGTIQHAGIVVGMGGWADHVFKEMKPVHYASPYISPVVTRNVMAVTGACMAISRDTINKIGLFDDEFIICGSDVEICVRAYNKGLNNIYNAGIKLYHLESKSRDSFIPEIDFKKSYECYGPCREYGDPYYNINLDINSVRPKEDNQVDWTKIKNHLRSNRLTANMYEGLKKKLTEPSAAAQAVVAEVQSIEARSVADNNDKIRINIIVPSVDVKHVFGGIATALTFFEKLTAGVDCMKRIIVTDAPVFAETMVDLPGYHVSDAMSDDESDGQIIPFADRAGRTIAVRKNDIFVATGWWTAYTIADVIRWQKATYRVENPLIYMVQDYEPGFYPWSSRYMMADSTYRLEIPTIAVINSKELEDFMKVNNYSFYRSFCYKPVLNVELKKHLLRLEEEKKVPRKKQIIVYGRPGVERNAFALIVGSLKRWVQLKDDVSEWNIIAAGESFEDIDLGKGKALHSIGKVSLKEYAEIMHESKAAISLMVSPHPSYPPLEMSTFGVRVITNTYGNKDLSSFNDNIVSLSNCSSEEIAKTLVRICEGEDGQCILDSEYVKDADSMQWEDIVKEIGDLLKSLN